MQMGKRVRFLPTESSLLLGAPPCADGLALDEIGVQSDGAAQGSS